MRRSRYAELGEQAVASLVASGWDWLETSALTGEYPGWAPKPEAPIVKLMASLYEERFGEKAPILACHAGLECGILGTNYPDMQMISFGPNIRGAHSPDEKVQISSVQKFWGYLLETLKHIPARQ